MTNKKIPCVPLIVSKYDLNYCLEKGNTGLTVDDLSEETIKEIFYSIGMMTDNEIELQDVLHRPRFIENNSVWKGVRYFGWEREDDEWLNSGKASLEIRIRKYAATDSGHYAELKRMSAESNFTAEYIDSLKRNKNTIGGI